MSEPIIINSGEEGLSATDISMVIAGTAAECDEVEHTEVEQYKNETYV